jgi:hypothetical protein
MEPRRSTRVKKAPSPIYVPDEDVLKKYFDEEDVLGDILLTSLYGEDYVPLDSDNELEDREETHVAETAKEQEISDIKERLDDDDLTTSEREDLVETLRKLEDDCMSTEEDGDFICITDSDDSAEYCSDLDSSSSEQDQDDTVDLTE